MLGTPKTKKTFFFKKRKNNYHFITHHVYSASCTHQWGQYWDLRLQLILLVQSRGKDCVKLLYEIIEIHFSCVCFSDSV